MADKKSIAARVVWGLLFIGAAGFAIGAPGDAPPVLESATNGNIRSYEVHLTLQNGGPDCWERPVVFANGLFQPTIEAIEGQRLEVTVYNDLPEEYPSIAEGISIHWHGLQQRESEWYDGVGFLHQCPIPSGTSFKYSFIADAPGTYFWHDHSAALRSDGLQGALIIYPKGVDPLYQAYKYKEDIPIIINDWYHTGSGALAMALNRPFDAAKQTAASGGFTWVGNPQAVLLNGKGYYNDCTIGINTTTCDVQYASVPAGYSAIQPFAAQTNPGCSHWSLTVERYAKYRLRLINAGTTAYVSVCFGGHEVLIVAADSTYTEQLRTNCIDINSGQRYDVILHADKIPKNYWINAEVQFRPKSPSGYGILSYAGFQDPAVLPSATEPQPGGVIPWTQAFTEKVVTSSKYAKEDLKPPPSTATFVINITQPLVQPTGQIRWALDNVAQSDSPPCDPFMKLVHDDGNYLTANAKDAAQNAGSPGVLGVQETSTADGVSIYLANTEDGIPERVFPVAGVHVLQIQKGEVIDIVLNNMAANAMNGDYRPGVGATRTATEQHPFHLHGHDFWVLGGGDGVYNPAVHASKLNTKNPIARDTVSVLRGGWAVIRFVADNPGMWNFHCHILWHQYMGQSLYFAEDVEHISAPPADLPACPATCPANAAPWSLTDVKEKWGHTGYQVHG